MPGRIRQLDVLDFLRHRLGRAAAIGPYELTAGGESEYRPSSFFEQNERLRGQIRCKCTIWHLGASVWTNRCSEEVDRDVSRLDLGANVDPDDAVAT